MRFLFFVLCAISVHCALSASSEIDKQVDFCKRAGVPFEHFTTPVSRVERDKESFFWKLGHHYDLRLIFDDKASLFFGSPERLNSPSYNMWDPKLPKISYPVGHGGYVPLKEEPKEGTYDIHVCLMKAGKLSVLGENKASFKHDPSGGEGSLFFNSPTGTKQLARPYGEKFFEQEITSNPFHAIQDITPRSRLHIYCHGSWGGLREEFLDTVTILIHRNLSDFFTRELRQENKSLLQKHQALATELDQVRAEQKEMQLQLRALMAERTAMRQLDSMSSTAVSSLQPSNRSSRSATPTNED